MDSFLYFDLDAENDPGVPLALALLYAAVGMLLVPMHTILSNEMCTCSKPTCHSPGKHPRVKDWPNVATCDEWVVRSWYEQFGVLNLALATGRGVAVLDVDPRNGGDASFHALFHELPFTLTVHTGGGGTHYYFSYDIASRPDLRSWDVDCGLELKAEGRLVILPGSSHHSGERYRWAVPA